MGARTISIHSALALVVVILTVLLARPAQASRLRGFPVRLQDSVENGPPLAFDIDADGQLELLIGARHAVMVVESDGNMSEGFPLKMAEGVTLATGLSAAVLNGPMLFFGTSDMRLWAVDGSAKPAPGFPVQLDGVLSGPPTIADIDGDGRPEIVCGTLPGKLYALGPDGKIATGFPRSAGAPISTAITVGQLASPQAGRRSRAKPTLLFGDQKGNLHAWTIAGHELSGFPFKARYTISSQPVLGDIDDDGAFEIIFGSRDYKIYALNGDGSQVKGFPVATGYRVYSTPALADLDGDGVADVVVAGGDGLLYGVGQGGRKIRGFPVKVGGRLHASAVVGDVDRDGRPEIAVGSEQNRLMLYRDNGRRYPGFPVSFPDRIEVAPVLADLNGDGLVDVIAASRDGTVSAYSMIKKGSSRKPLAWPAEGRDSARNSRSYPNPPRYKNLSISPAEPATDDSLELSYEFFDLDGDPEPQTIVHWQKNGKTVRQFDGARQVPASATRKHQRWRFVLQAAKKGALFTSPEVKLRNTPPEPPEIAIRPDPARCQNDLRLEIVKGSHDADGDKVSYAVSWLKDHRPVKKLHSRTVRSALIRAGQRWTVVVTPSDGEQRGMPARTSIVISNTAPTAPAVHIEPARPSVTQALRAVIDKPGRDPDSDQVSYRYTWTAGGKPLNLPPDTQVLPAGLAAKHEKIELEVTSFDGHQPGGKIQAAVELVNSPPPTPAIKIVPGKPTTLDDLAVEISSQPVDEDHDKLSYQVSWQRAKKPYRGQYASSRAGLPASETAKGEQWTVTVVPADGESRGKPARAKVVIGNAPPRKAVLTAADARPRTDSNLVLKIAKPAEDPDGDKVSQQVIWYRVDARGARHEIKRGPNLFSLPAEATRKNTRYLARLIPSDGTATGKAAEQWFDVRNSPPGACRVALDPQEPTSGQDLVAKLTSRSGDADGDQVEMSYRWYKNDQAMIGMTSDRVAGKLVKRGQRWMVVATPSDGESAGPACRAEVEVGNLPPVAPVIAIEPVRPRATDSLSCKILHAARDSDGDKLELRYRWTVGGHQPELDGHGATIPAGMLVKNQKWRLQVTAFDGALSSKPVEAAVVVGDSPPGTPPIDIRPRKPLSSDDLVCQLTGRTSDLDGDRLTFSYAWFRVEGKNPPSGKPLQTGRVLTAGHTRRGQRWLCRVTASDGELSGPPAEASVVIANAAPSTPKVRVLPAEPRDKEDLRCQIDSQASDPDGDRVKYVFVWYKDGLKQAFAPQTDKVPARLTGVNEIWQCMVRASDGLRTSKPVQSAEVVIRK